MLVLAGANRRDHRLVHYVVQGKRVTEAVAKQQGVTGPQLALLQREMGDGLLTAYEVIGLDLTGTDLVILTACETGIGVTPGGKEPPGLKQTKGEGVAGLRQAFTIAGARSLIISMWSVPLDPTADQM